MSAPFHVKRKGFLQMVIVGLVGWLIVAGLVVVVRWLTQSLAALLVGGTMVLLLTFWGVR